MVNTIHDRILVAAMGFMAFLTFSVLLIMFKRRMGAMKSRQVHPKEFKLYENEHLMPATVVQASRNYKNLYEMPLLFYVASLLLLSAQVADLATSALAMLYCLTRAAHSYIHLGSNKLIPRLRMFALSFFILLALWGYALVKVLAGGNIFP